jgi:SNF2 domain-containing protein/helicase-like protein
MKFVYEPQSEGAVIKEKRLIGSPRTVDRWIDSATPTQLHALSKIREWAAQNEDEARITGDEVFLGNAAIARLSDTHARALGLPTSCPFAIRLESETHVKSADFRVNIRWVRQGGIPVRTKQNGAFLRNAGILYRVPSPLFEITQLAADLGQELADDDRLAAYGSLVSSLRQHIDPSINADDYLDRVTVYHAAAFSLQLGISNDELDFDPILFGREIVEETKDGSSVDEVDAALLSPRHQAIFAKNRFRSYPEARRSYVLEDGSFVVLEPALLRAMQVVREASSSDSDTRRKFISNPTGFIKAAVGDEDGSAVDEMFIETEQFSERVTGVDIWRKPVMPWIKPAPETWIPEKFGVQLGDDDPIEVPGDKVADVLKAYDTAQEDGAETFSWEGHTFPVNEQARAAFATLAELQERIEGTPAEPKRSDLDDAPDTELSAKRFLTITENLDALGYEKVFVPTTHGNMPVAVPETVKATLKSYQDVGFKWLVSSFSSGMPGVLLADDMGLGKTLQALSFLAWLRETAPSRPAPILIVAPTGLLANWKAEIEKHLTPGALGTVLDAYGAALKALRSDQSKGAEIGLGKTVLDLSEWKDAGVVLTTYETMRDFHFSFAKMPFGTILFDEIQKLKNPASQVSRAARTLNSDFKIGISGTPVENKLQDLWSIMDVVWPGFLGASKKFEQEFPAHDQTQLEQLHSIVFEASKGRPAVGLRRLKASELDGLPPKEEFILETEMPPDQAKAYASVVNTAIAARGSMSAGDSMLKTLQDLRSISLHPEAPSSGYANMDTYVSRSARLVATMKTLEAIRAKGEKALVFVESLEMQSFLADYLQRKFDLSRRPDCISGKVPGAKRQDIVDTFQSNPKGFDVLILSPKAGGVGLTITAANHVIHLSRWWNPAVEDQSTDRVFRIGQRKNVSVYLPVAVSPFGASFDQKLDQLLRKKRTLAGKMLMPPEIRDADASQLFNELTDVEIQGAPPTPPARTDRSTLAVAEAGGTAEVSPPDGTAPSIPVHGARVFTYGEGKAPCYDDMFSDLAGMRIERLELIDPYAMWRMTGQAALSRVIAELAKRASSLQRVQLVFKPPNSVGGREFETTDKALHNLRSQLAVMAQRESFLVPQIRCKERRPTKERDFHDRYVVVRFERDNSLLEREYLVSRGLDAFERHEWRVDVTIKPDATRVLEAA